MKGERVGWLPLTRKHWAENEKLFAGIPALKDNSLDEAETIRRNVDWLLARLYEPNAEIGARASQTLCRAAGVEDEPINWGDLSADAEHLGKVWIVTLEEASDGQCPTLCAYVEKWLKAWGWKTARVQTTW